MPSFAGLLLLLVLLGLLVSFCPNAWSFGRPFLSRGQAKRETVKIEMVEAPCVQPLVLPGLRAKTRQEISELRVLFSKISVRKLVHLQLEELSRVKTNTSSFFIQDKKSKMKKSKHVRCIGRGQSVCI